jgi:D-alanyl-D-alanine carboxypeptidase/D-alanyl-D-alanine-endopeptidase (penicillin-binding protein 4)
LAACLLLPLLSLQAQPAEALRQLLRADGLAHASIGVSVKRVADGRVICEHAPVLSLRPASVLKILPALLALEKRGERFTYRTTLSYTGEIRDGVLDGQLLVAAGGDPALESAYFPRRSFLQRAVEAIREAGITHLRAAPAVVGADDPVFIPGSWPWEDLSNHYGATYHPFNYRDNSYALTLQAGAPGAPAEIVALFPAGINLAFDNRVITDPAGRNEVWIYGGPSASPLLLRGSVTGDPRRYTVKGAMHDPARAFIGELIDRLEHAGVTVDAPPSPRDAPLPATGAHVLLTEESPPLSEIIYHANKRSVNLFAEALGALVDPARFDRAAKERLSASGIDTSGVTLADASGLSPANVAPASFFTDLLRWAYPRASRAFWNSLPQGATDAPLAIYSDHPALGKRLHAKTGSMTGVRALAGYLLTPRDGLLAFTILINNYTCTPRQLQEHVRDFLAALP